MSYQLRDYQEDCIQSIFDYFDNYGGNTKRNPVVDACVGAGKSIMIAETINRIINLWPNQKILMLVHSRELVSQNYEKLKAIAPNLDVGIYSAGLNKKQLGHQITYASIQSVYKIADKIGFKNLIFIDEVHTISKASSKGIYRKFITEMQTINPKLRLIGWTGTPYRLDGGSIVKGKERLFTDISYSITIRHLLDKGYLSPLVNAPVSQVNTDNIRITAGDYNLKDITSLMDDELIIKRAVNEIVKHGSDRKSWLIFCSSIEHAKHVRDEIRKHDIWCETINGKTNKYDRDRILKQFKSHDIQAITNVGVLTTGFDHPGTDLIALLRPTASPGLFVQMLGRGLRTAPGKENCLFLDFTDTTEKLGAIDNIKEPVERNNDGQIIEQPEKICPECNESIAISSMVCDFCGYQYPPKTLNHSDTVSAASILSGYIPNDIEYEITDVKYSTHNKPGKPTSMKVDYYSGLRKVCSEWVCYNHEGYAKTKAISWMQKRNPENFYNFTPDVIDRFLQKPDDSLFKVPSKIIVNESGKYPEIKKVIF